MNIRWRPLVYTGSMIWPQDLVSAAFLHTLHDDKRPDPRTTNGWKIGRYQYFVYVFVGSFLWYWVPGLIAPFLSVFAFVTWIKPNSPVVNQLFGGWTGLSLIPITFDWTQVAGTNLHYLILASFMVSIPRPLVRCCGLLYPHRLSLESTHCSMACHWKYPNWDFPILHHYYCRFTLYQYFLCAISSNQWFRSLRQHWEPI